MEILLLVITLFARLIVGILFIVAGWSKLRAGKSLFLRTVLAYELLPRQLSLTLARSLPLIEIMIGSMLLLGLLIQPLAYLGLVLLIIFTGAVITALVQKKTISCGCFGPKEKVTPIRWTIIIRNLVLMLMTSAVALQKREILTLDSLLKSYVGSAGLWYIGFVVAAILVLSTYFYAQSLTVSPA